MKNLLIVLLLGILCISANQNIPKSIIVDDFLSTTSACTFILSKLINK